MEIIEKWLKDSDRDVRNAAMNAWQGREVPLEIIEKWLEDSDCDVRNAAMNACQGREVPLEIIEKWLEDSDWKIRNAAMNARQGREVPLEIIETGLKDSDCDVRNAAMKLYKDNGLPTPIIRTIEPPEIVYKKCVSSQVGTVIICARIPKDAQVRGSFGRKCRTNKAIITDVLGTLGGEPVGISIWDKKTSYYTGDEIEVEDFDMSNEECSTGFHFFCTKAEAESY